MVATLAGIGDACSERADIACCMHAQGTIPSHRTAGVVRRLSGVARG